MWAKNKVVITAIAVAVVIVIDYLSKLWAQVHFSKYRELAGSGGFFAGYVVQNKGLAMNFLQDWSTIVPGAVLGLNILAIAFLLIVFWHFLPTGSGIAVAIYIGGAMANALDRYFHGAVTDFIVVHNASVSFPVFNLADVAMTIGGTAVLIALFRQTTVAETAFKPIKFITQNSQKGFEKINIILSG